MPSAAAFVALGWAATAVYVFAQAYLSWKRDYSERLYYALNALGAAGFIASSAAIASWQSVAINLFWLIVSVLSLLNIKTYRRLSFSRWWVIGPLLGFCAVSLFWLQKDPQQAYAMLGWGGSLLYCGSYALFAVHIIRRVRFLGYNSFAALLLLPVYALQNNWPAFALSVLWAMISASGCYAALRRQRLEENG